ncbi:hypothetical protein BJ166DRAFT_331145 [Pestalotiopsis sp. NC0098]|nr:hypothetical protein BJ166DRAFT_331145 [Pestalotiopsis sp. NC0098]
MDLFGFLALCSVRAFLHKVVLLHRGSTSSLSPHVLWSPDEICPEKSGVLFFDTLRKTATDKSAFMISPSKVTINPVDLSKLGNQYVTHGAIYLEVSAVRMHGLLSGPETVKMSGDAKCRKSQGRGTRRRMRSSTRVHEQLDGRICPFWAGPQDWCVPGQVPSEHASVGLGSISILGARSFVHNIDHRSRFGCPKSTDQDAGRL